MPIVPGHRLLPDEMYPRAKELFEPFVADGETPRCQSSSRQRARVLGQRVEDGHEPTDEDLKALQCHYSAQKGFPVCGVHGAGFAVRGKRGGRPIEHGRYSKHMKNWGLREKQEEALNDPDLMVMRHEMALIVARISQILDNWTDNPPDMDELGDVVTSVGQALQAGEMDVAQQEYLRLVEVFSAGKGQWAVWREIRQLIEQQRKLQIAEMNRLEKLQQFITANQLMTFTHTVLDIIKKKPKEVLARYEGETLTRKLLRTIVDEISREIAHEFDVLSTAGPLRVKVREVDL